MLYLAGHRGLPAHYPENTVEGVTAALSAGAAGVEIDIQFSKDGEPVLLHDMGLQRVAGLSGDANAFELALLTKMSAHEPERFGDAFLPTPIAPLSDLVAVMRSYPEALLFVEIKEESFTHLSREAIVNKVALCLAPIAEQVVIIAYDLAVLRLMRECVDWPVGWVLTQYDDASYQLATQFQPEYLICNYTKLPAPPTPLWSGLWQWFIYDITQGHIAQALHERGVSWIESWDVESLVASVQEPA
ncbi:MAG TPA: glycerophosphodiester phosphodiesterase family protein [Marinagarivorans sp.]